MAVPEKYFEIMTKFQKALKSEDFTEIDLIPLSDLKLAKAHLVNDKGSAYYPLLLDKITERESMNLQSQTTKEPLIFMSYDTRDLELVKAIAEMLHRVFDPKIKTFIAKRDIKAGDDAFKTMLHENLAKCVVVLAVCTKRSVTSPWLWFESGAGFEKSGLIPIWSGVSPLDFKAPMTIFQGKNIQDKVEVHELLSKIAELLGSGQKEPTLTDEEFSKLAETSKQLDIKYKGNITVAAPSAANSRSTHLSGVYCKRCGAAPGKQSTCNGGYINHDFAPITGAVYCKRCGATPGEQSLCNGGYINHDFDSSQV